MNKKELINRINTLINEEGKDIQWDCFYLARWDVNAGTVYAYYSIDYDMLCVEAKSNGYVPEGNNVILLKEDCWEQGETISEIINFKNDDIKDYMKELGIEAEYIKAKESITDFDALYDFLSKFSLEDDFEGIILKKAKEKYFDEFKINYVDEYDIENIKFDEKAASKSKKFEIRYSINERVYLLKDEEIFNTFKKQREYTDLYSYLKANNVDFKIIGSPDDPDYLTKEEIDEEFDKYEIAIKNNIADSTESILKSFRKIYFTKYSLYFED